MGDEGYRRWSSAACGLRRAQEGLLALSSPASPEVPHDAPRPEHGSPLGGEHGFILLPLQSLACGNPISFKEMASLAGRIRLAVALPNLKALRSCRGRTDRWC